jgi:hypothetical protein
VSALIEEGGAINLAVTPEMSPGGEAFVMTSKGYSIYGLAPQMINKKMQPLSFAAKKDRSNPTAYRMGAKSSFMC